MAAKHIEQEDGGNPDEQTMSKNRLKSKSTCNWPTTIIIAVITLGIGFYLGQRGETDSTETASLDKAPVVDTLGSTEQAKSLSPEQLAVAKNVPAKIESDQGDFTLVAVVEGEDGNKSLHRSLQVVNVQRQQLGQLSRNFDQTAPAMAQQRELIAGKINETRKALEQNLKFMAQNFAYTLSNNYLLVPHLATISSVEGKGKDQKKTLIYTFKNATSYEEFQKKSEAYGTLKREQLKAHQASQPAAGEAPTHPLQPLPPEKSKTPAPLPLTPAMKTAQAEMIQTYQCDPEKQYLVEYQKTALYARKAK